MQIFSVLDFFQFVGKLRFLLENGPGTVLEQDLPCRGCVLLFSFPGGLAKLGILQHFFSDSISHKQIKRYFQNQGISSQAVGLFICELFWFLNNFFVFSFLDQPESFPSETALQKTDWRFQMPGIISVLFWQFPKRITLAFIFEEFFIPRFKSEETSVLAHSHNPFTNTFVLNLLNPTCRCKALHIIGIYFIAGLSLAGLICCCSCGLLLVLSSLSSKFHFQYFIIIKKRNFLILPGRVAIWI